MGIIFDAPDSLAKGQEVYDQKLLLVDDDLFIHKLVSKMLHGVMEVVTTGRADHVVPLYAKEKPSLVMLDIHMPKRHGFELLRDVLRHDPYAHVVMVSGDATRENVIRSKDRGAKSFMMKPFCRNKIMETVSLSQKQREIEATCAL